MRAAALTIQTIAGRGEAPGARRALGTGVFPGIVFKALADILRPLQGHASSPLFAFRAQDGALGLALNRVPAESGIRICSPLLALAYGGAGGGVPQKLTGGFCSPPWKGRTSGCGGRELSS